MANFLEVPVEEISIKAVREGSVKVTLELPEAVAFKLLEFANKHPEPLLRDFAISKVEALKNWGREVRPFQTHLPHYSLQAAAGRFLENEEVAEEGWVETPPDLRLTPYMFVANVKGHSMERLIEDGAICVFAAHAPGPFQGRLLLVEELVGPGNNKYAVKRFKMESSVSEEGWVARRVWLESLNPAYPSWKLEADEVRYRIVGEFVRVLH